jgi:quinol monooxygenase YgiN
MLMIEGWLATNQEVGCLHYAFAQDIADPDLIRISERWESQEALAAHGASAHMAEFNKAMGGVQREGADLRLYTADEVRRLM